MSGWTSAAELFADVRNVVRARELWRPVLERLRPYRWRLAGFATAGAFGVLAVLAQPFLFREAVDMIVVRVESGRSDHDVARLWVITGLVLAVRAVNVAATLVQARARAAITEDLLADLRLEVFDRLQRMPFGAVVHASPGAMTARVGDEAAIAASTVPTVVTDGFTAALTLAVGAVAVTAFDWRLAAVLALVGLFLIPSRWIRDRIRSRVMAHVVVQAHHTGVVQERLSVSGALLTRVFGRYEDNIDQLRSLAARQRELSIGAAYWQGLQQALVGAGIAVTMAVIIGFGGHQVLEGSMTLGTLVLLMLFVRILAGPIQRYAAIRHELTRGAVAFGRLFEVLDFPASEPPRPSMAAAEVLDSSVELRSVGFAYQSSESLIPASLVPAHLPRSAAIDGTDAVLADVSLRAGPGEFVALVGPSGAGKSTIAALAAGLYRATSGTILIGGAPIDDLDEATLRSTVGLVTQDTHLMHDTIRANLLMARPAASDKEMVRACVAAGIHRFVRSLPNGYGTVVGERGVRLSGGQRQRLAFARVLLADPSIVILDEATAHLDAESEALLREAVDSMLADRTRLVIAHRLSTIVDADQIVVLEHGRITERGTHDDLIAAGSRYHALYQTQLLHAGSSDLPSPASAAPPSAARVGAGSDPKD